MPTKRQIYERYAHAITGDVIYQLVEALEGAATHVRDMGCTCVDGMHGPACMGEQYSKPYFALVRRVRRKAQVEAP